MRDLPPRILGPRASLPGATAGAGGDASSSLNLETMEKHFIRQALRMTDRNVTEAAKLLGISRRTLHRKIKSYGIEPA